VVRAVDAAGHVSDPSNPDTATVVPPDSQTPTVPGNLVATGSPGQVALSWDASSDDLGVTGYRVYRDDQQIAANVTTTSFTDTGRPPGTYSYKVRAEDAAGHLSDPSAAAGATVPDVDKPSVPQSVNAADGGAGQVNLTWQASTDNVQVTGYRVYRGGTQIAVLGATTSFTDTGRGPGTYSYTVRAADAAGNLSDPSSAASITLPDVSDPSAPKNLVAAAQSSTRIGLTWEASTDDVGVTGYRIYRGGNQLASIGAVTSYTDTSVSAGNAYTYEVRALDGAGHLSGPSNSSSATTPLPAALTFSADADAEVNAGAPTTNYATAKLRTDFDSTPEDSFLRFTVAGAAGGVQSAKLRVFAYTASADGPAVYTAGSSWTETGINWNNRPARTSGPTDDKGAIAANTWMEFDVTPFVTGNGTYNFSLAQTTSDGVDIRSREWTTVANRPQLVVTLP
jgi:fibronectin type 3 domain-containing protein